MKFFGLVGLMFMLNAEAADANWLLWRHNFVGLGIEGNVDKWDLLNAVDLRRNAWRR